MAADVALAVLVPVLEGEGSGVPPSVTTGARDDVAVLVLVVEGDGVPPSVTPMGG